MHDRSWKWNERLTVFPGPGVVATLDELRAAFEGAENAASELCVAVTDAMRQVDDGSAPALTEFPEPFFTVDVRNTRTFNSPQE